MGRIYLALLSLHLSMSKASIPTYRNMKVSAMNDIVANACLKLSATVKIITFSTETHDTTVKRTKVSASLRGKKKGFYSYLVVIRELSVTLCHV